MAHPTSTGEARLDADLHKTRDPFALELIKNSLVTLADEMALTVSRTARSFVVKEAMDFSTALFMANGELIAQAISDTATCIPLPVYRR